MGERSLISVVVPAWRAEKTLAATLDSILSQTWRELEVLVVDDASPDGTLALAQSYAGERAARPCDRAAGERRRIESAQPWCA